MEFLVKKTTELLPSEKEGINKLFNVVFKKERPVEEFENQFLQNVLGYSYHSFLIDKGLVVGHTAVVPSSYLVNGEKQLFGCSVDTMVMKGYRGIENFWDLEINGVNAVKDAGFTVFYGFPNDNAYPVVIKSKLMADVGKLTTFCLPYRIGGIKHGMSFLDPISKLFCRCLLGISSWFASGNVVDWPIVKDASYNETRYKRFDGDYKYSTLKDGSKFYYKIIDFDGIKSAFLIDIERKSSRNFCEAAKYILKQHSKDFDILLYVGSLPFVNTGLVKIPMRFAPKKFNFCARVLNKKACPKELVFNIGNWDINLSNYDLL